MKEVPALAQIPEIYPAHASRPFVRPHGSGIVFSAVFPRGMECGLQLIHTPDGETLYIPFTDEFRVGRVCSAMITPLDSKEWMYRYKSGEHWIPDPHAFAIGRTVICEGEERKEVTACSCAPLRAGDLFAGAPEKPLPPADWSKEVIYGLHIRGFSAARESLDENLRGTFTGAAAGIPYLRGLGVTAVEIMPVYTPLPDRTQNKQFRTMGEALGAYPVGPNGDPLRDLKSRPNYWGFGAGLYCALRSEYGTQEEFAAMIHAFHKAGMRVILQMYFEKGVLVQEQIEILRFYIDRYGIDGFRLKGFTDSEGSLATDPSLADTALFSHSFPFEELEKEAENAGQIYYTDLEKILSPSSDHTDGRGEDTGKVPGGAHGAGPGAGPAAAYRPARKQPPRKPLHDFSGLITCSDEFQTLLRRFVKSDDYVMKDFLKLFLTVPEDHGVLRYVTSYEGFTLADLVSYNDRHNEANGEYGLDGNAENYSWNCGEEGHTDNEEVLALRRKQVRNFLTLLILSRGTPMLWQGDECGNSQSGNNNAYCQDNEISWVDWSASPEKKKLSDFTAKLIAFRKDHPVFSGRKPFHYIDYLGIGHPDVSLHGAEAWNPDLGPFSHSIGIAFCENYVSGASRKFPAFTYLAINTYWKELSLALPKLPPHYIWQVCMDTADENGFLDKVIIPGDQHCVETAPRSIRILRAVPDTESIRREKAQERLDRLPSTSVLKNRIRRAMASGTSGKKDAKKAKLHQAYIKRCIRAAGRSLPPRDRH